MFRSQKMKLAELMILAQDIDKVLEYLGKKANFQFQQRSSFNDVPPNNQYKEYYDKLDACRSYLGIIDRLSFVDHVSLPSPDDVANAEKLLSLTDDIKEREQSLTEAYKQCLNAYEETSSFANLNIAYSEFDNLSFLTIRIGAIDPDTFETLKLNLGERAVVVPLNNEQTRILAASSKKGRFGLDSELKKYNFVPMNLPLDYQGIPKEILAHLKEEKERAEEKVKNILSEKKQFGIHYQEMVMNLLQNFSLGAQIQQVRQSLEATQLVYRVVGWLPEDESAGFVSELDNLTAGRIAIRLFSPEEVPTIKSGKEKVPVRYKHGAFVRSYERMVFSYGAPLYGTIDPTPIVAISYTILFGIMFGDLGQGLVFFLLGLFMYSKKIRALHKWQHFDFVFISIGLSSMIMGLLTGEFFANDQLLVPFGRWLTGLFGTPADRVLHLMPSKGSIEKLLMFFGFTLGLGFIINSLGIIINIINQFRRKHSAEAVFSQTGLCGLLFFWYVVAMALRIAFFHIPFQWFDILGMVIPLVGIFFKEMFVRISEHKKPIFPEGIGMYIMQGVIEIMDVVSGFFSNSMSFLRVGAFALAHAVLSFVVFTMTDFVGGYLTVQGILITVIGNLIIICLEGLIVGIQVVRLQYYEFFSKFFTENGRVFTPFRFKYKEG